MARPIGIVGTGHVGVACMIELAELGWTVHGYDIAPDRIKRLRLGTSPIREAGMQEALQKHIAGGRMHFFTSLEAAVGDAEVVLVSVGTRSCDDGSADLAALKSAMDELSAVPFRVWPTIVIRSTVPPGTCDRLAPFVEQWGELICAPEFLRGPSTVRHFAAPSCIVVGARRPSISVPYLRLFETLQKTVVYTSLCNAELVKSCSNAFLAMKMTFANEVANLCDALGADSDDVLRGMSYDPRIGSELLQPGIGFGGWLEEDVKSIRHVATQLKVSRELVSATLRVNEMQQTRVIDALEQEIGNLQGAVLGVWGLVFKAGTSDVRHSLAFRIVCELAARGAAITVYDPAVHVAPLPRGSRFVGSALEATDADALLVLTDWPEFSELNPLSFAFRLKQRIVIDGCNVLDPKWIVSAGLTYRGIGRTAASGGSHLSHASAV